MKDKAKFNSEGWTFHRHGLQRRDYKENRNNNDINIPWSVIKKEGTGIRGLTKIKHNDIELFMLRKSIDRMEVSGLFDTEDDALRYFDLALIKRGREPMYKFKKK